MEIFGPVTWAIFGGLGDLSARKILPALYLRHKYGQSFKGPIFLIHRNQSFNYTPLEWLEQNVKQYIEESDPLSWKDFAKRIIFYMADSTTKMGYSDLKDVLLRQGNYPVIFYLSTPSSATEDIMTSLDEARCFDNTCKLVLEKPLGHSLESYIQLNDFIKKFISEEQIYRIDHYLGKETVQNLMVLRFANSIFEQIWHNKAIDHIQITVAEEIGVSGRKSYYDQYGALKDMVQNHLLQLLCLVAMEPPSKATPDNIRSEKIKVLESLEAINHTNARERTSRGQYAAGSSHPGYLKDINRDRSNTETFVALKVSINNWRWSGVPFYLCTGKRMPKKYSEIMVQFDQVSHNIFPDSDKPLYANKLIIRIQPAESVKLQIMTKSPGPGGYRLQPVSLNLNLKETHKDIPSPGAYERLLMDVIRGTQTLFTHAKEVHAAWEWVDDICAAWKENIVPLESYAAGSWGPESATELIEKDGFSWHHTNDD